MQLVALLGWNLSSGYSPCGVLHGSSGFSSFLSPPKNIVAGGSVMLNYPLGVNEYGTEYCIYMVPMTRREYMFSSCLHGFILDSSLGVNL